MPSDRVPAFEFEFWGAPPFEEEGLGTRNSETKRLKPSCCRQACSTDPNRSAVLSTGRRACDSRFLPRNRGCLAR